MKKGRNVVFRMLPLPSKQYKPPSTGFSVYGGDNSDYERIRYGKKGSNQLILARCETVVSPFQFRSAGLNEICCHRVVFRAVQCPEVSFLDERTHT